MTGIGQPQPSLTARRFLALWFPFLPADRLRAQAHRGASRDSIPAEGEPLALIEKRRGAMRLAACDAAARERGLSPGMTLADARARVPDVVAVQADVAADRVWLDAIADACDRFTPLVMVEPPDGLVLDMTGCLHRYDDEPALLVEVGAAMRRWPSVARAAMAATPEGARALARFQMLPAPDEASALRRLPVAALELDSENHAGLRRAGFRTLCDLADRPMAPLAARFGGDLVDRLRRILGEGDSRLVPRRMPPALAVERRFAEPIATADAALGVMGDLAAEVQAMLETRGRGGRRFVARLYRSDGHVTTLAIDSSRPLRDAQGIARLFVERVGSLNDPLDPGFGYDMIRLAVPRAEPLAVAQLALEGGTTGKGADGEDIAALVDRLSTRVGARRVRRFVPRDSHLPEQTALALPAIEAPAPAPWPAPEPGEPPLRPLHMFDPPQPVEVIAAVPDGPPQRFRWRRTLHEVVYAEGPERIAAEWWRRAPGDHDLTRDYYRVEDGRGRRFWLFRHGLYGSECTDPRWYVHGLFA
jgi:protein ImuB